MSGKEKEAVWEESTFLFATIFCSKQLSDPDLASELQASLSGCDINSCLLSTLLFQSPLCWDNRGSTSKNRGYLNPHLLRRILVSINVECISPANPPFHPAGSLLFIRLRTRYMLTVLRLKKSARALPTPFRTISCFPGPCLRRLSLYCPFVIARSPGCTPRLWVRQHRDRFQGFMDQDPATNLPACDEFRDVPKVNLNGPCALVPPACRDLKVAAEASTTFSFTLTKRRSFERLLCESD